MRSIEIKVKFHPESQFPITLVDADTGNNLAEVPLCDKTREFFNVRVFREDLDKKVKLYCEDL